MRRLSVFVSLILLAGSCTMPTALVSFRDKQKTTPPVSPAGLEEGSMTYDKRSGFSWLFQYDDKNLYLNLAAADRDLQRKIVFFGMTVWIDRDGGKNTGQGFTYPIGFRLPVAPGQGLGARPGRSFSPQDMESALKLAEEIDLIGIYGSSTRRVKVRDSRIRTEARIIDDVLFYSAVIPYEVLQFGYSPVSSGTPVSIGLETGRFEPPSSSRRQEPDDARRGGGGMRPAGGMTGQTPGRMPYAGPADQRDTNMGALSRSTKLWIMLEFDK